jgi:hypothetical protein
MQAATLALPAEDTVTGDPRLRQLALVRIAAGESGATRADIARDLTGLFSHKPGAAQWHALLNREIDILLLDGCATEAGERLTLQDAGAAAVRRFLGLKGILPHDWSELRDVRLIARALGLERTSVKQLKALKRADGLRAAIVQQAYKLKIKGIATPSRLRAALATVALQRAFGNQISAELGGKGGLSPKAGRLLAGQLSRTPRDYGTDGRLIAALAAEHVGAKQSDLDTLRQGVLRRFFEGLAHRRDEVRAVPRPVPKEEPLPVGVPHRPVVSGRPDLPGFVREVRRHAQTHAQGWPGNRKAYISHVWRALGQARADWGLSEIEFKCMLVEAHRAGELALSNADLKDHKSIKDVQDSAVVYKNAVFHFVRVDS